jgi:hypothetical protein
MVIVVENAANLAKIVKMEPLSTKTKILCDDGCHVMAEKQPPEEGYAPDELFALINSSEAKAIKASEALG